MTKTKTKTKRQAKPAQPSATKASPAAPMPQPGESAAERRAQAIAEAVAQGKVQKVAPGAQSVKAAAHLAAHLEECKRSLQMELGQARTPALLERDDRAVHLVATRTPSGFLDGVPYYIPSGVPEDQRDNWAKGATSSATFWRHWQELLRCGRPAPTNPRKAVEFAEATMASIGYGILPGTVRDQKPAPPQWARDRKEHRKRILATHNAAKKLSDALNSLAQLEGHGLGARLDCFAAAAFRGAVAEFKVTGKKPSMLEPRVKTPDRRRRFFSDLEQELEWEKEIIRGKDGPHLVNARRDEWSNTLKARCGLKGQMLDAVMRALGFKVPDSPESTRQAARRHRNRTG